MVHILAPNIFLLIGQRNTITRFMVETTISSPDVTLPIPALRSIRAIEYDVMTDYIYWIDGRTKMIRRARDNGSNVR